MILLKHECQPGSITYRVALQHYSSILVHSHLFRAQIWFALNGHTLYMLSGARDRADWVKNALRSSAVQLKIKDKVFSGRARLVKDTKEDALARKLLADKYTPRSSDDLTDWSSSALPVAVDLVV